jgi:hypothetical protein
VLLISKKDALIETEKQKEPAFQPVLKRLQKRQDQHAT